MKDLVLDSEVALENHEQALTRLAEISASFEGFQDTGVKAETALYLKHAINSAINPIGMSFTMSSSFEDFNGSRSRLATIATMEDIGDVVKSIIEKIKQIVEALLIKLSDIIEHITKRMVGIDARFEKVIAGFSKFSNEELRTHYAREASNKHHYQDILGKYSSESRSFVDGLKIGLAKYKEVVAITNEVGGKLISFTETSYFADHQFVRDATPIVEKMKVALVKMGGLDARRVPNDNIYGATIYESKDIFLGRKVTMLAIKMESQSDSYDKYGKAFKLMIEPAGERQRVLNDLDLGVLCKSATDIFAIVKDYRQQLSLIDKTLPAKIRKLTDIKIPDLGVQSSVYDNMLSTVKIVKSILDFETSLAALLSNAIHAGLRVCEMTLSDLEKHKSETV